MGNEGLIYSTILGNSADVMGAILQLYLPNGGRIADLTMHTGAFWRKADRGKYEVVGSDIERYPGVHVLADLGNTPYRNDSFDMAILDPPYGNGSSVPRTDFGSSYNLPSTMGSEAINATYRMGIGESQRICRPNGTIVVKCQPIVNSGKNQWTDIECYHIARMFDLEITDRFMLLPKTRGRLNKGQTQRHARKWGSFFWVFTKRKA